MIRSANIALTVAVCWLAVASTVSAWPLAKQLQSRLSVDDALNSRIERFRRQMPCGINGGPPLAPYRLEELDLTQDQPGTIESTGMLRNVTVSELDGFHVDYMTFSVFRLRLDYSITFPRILTNGQYVVNATILDMIQVWGAGPFDFNLYNVNINGFLRFGISMGARLRVVEMESLLSVDRIESRIMGILDDDEGSEFYNMLIEQFLPPQLAENQRELSNTISTLLMPIINEQLADVTLADLIAGADEDDEVECVVEQRA